MRQLKRKIIAFTALLMLGGFFLSSSPVLAASAKETLTADDWIILQVPIPFPGCSNAALKNNVKCCDEEIIKTYYAQTNSGLGQTYKSAAPTCPSGSVAAIKDIPSLILVAVQFLTIAIIIMMVLLMIISGIQYITSFGNAEKAKKSLERVKHAAFGLVIVLFSSVILYQVNPKLLSLSIAKPGQITQVQLIEHCSAEGITKCGDKVKGSDTCIGRQCDTGNYCSETKVEDTSSFACKKLIELGSECTSNEECKTSLCSPSVTDSSKQVCTSLDKIIGKSCNSSAECGGYFCNAPWSGGNVCTFGLLGNQCADNSGCNANAGNICVSADLLTGSTCSLSKTPYSVCNNDLDCPLGYLCAQGIYYNGFADLINKNNDEKTCLPPSKTDPKVPTKVFKCNSNSSADEHGCNSSPFGTTYCAGASSALWINDYCTPGLIGNPCSANNECASKFCFTDKSAGIFGICTDGKIGDSCVGNDQCASGYCSQPTVGVTYKSRFCINKS